MLMGIVVLHCGKKRGLVCEIGVNVIIDEDGYVQAYQPRLSFLIWCIQLCKYLATE